MQGGCGPQVRTPGQEVQEDGGGTSPGQDREQALTSDHKFKREEMQLSQVSSTAVCPA